MATKELRLRTIGMVCAFAILTACSASDDGSGASASSPTAVKAEPDAVRFLSYATFGGSQSEVNSVVERDAADWLA
ncbi:MAG: hypothetical protein AAGJ84_13985, partial [Pseudomonadota bacterium]